MTMSRKLRIRKNKYLEESITFDNGTIIDDDSDGSDCGSLSYTKRRKILVYSKCRNSGTKLKKVSQIQEVKSSNNFKTIQLIFDDIDSHQNCVSKQNDSLPLKLHNEKVLQQNTSVQSFQYNQNRSNKCIKTQDNLESYDLSTFIEDIESECFECIEQQTNSCLSPNLIIDDDEENQENVNIPILSQNISSLSFPISNNSDENKDYRILKQLIQQDKQKIEHLKKVRYKSGGYFEKLNEILKKKKVERTFWYHERQVWGNNNDTKGIIENTQMIYGRVVINIKLINNERIIILMDLDQNIEENLKIGSSVIVSLDNYVYNVLNQVVRIPCYKILKT